MTGEQIQQLETVCFMFKYLKNLLPNSFAHFFSNNFIDPNIKKRQQATPLISQHFID